MLIDEHDEQYKDGRDDEDNEEDSRARESQAVIGEVDVLLGKDCINNFISRRS